jgi:hypothetical protein
MLFTACLVIGFEALLFVAAPGSCMCPMFSEPPPLSPWLIPAVGVGAQALGLAWMIRIYRADPEGHRSWWRFHRS